MAYFEEGVEMPPPKPIRPIHYNAKTQELVYGDGSRLPMAEASPRDLVWALEQLSAKYENRNLKMSRMREAHTQMNTTLKHRTKLMERYLTRAKKAEIFRERHLGRSCTLIEQESPHDQGAD